MLKFATWNVNNRLFKPSHINFLESLQLDVLALQEISSGFHSALVDSGIFNWGVSSLALRPAEVGETTGRKLGCSIFGNTSVHLQASTLVPGVALPERTLVAQLSLGNAEFTACSFHIPPGVSWKEIKPQTMCALADYLAQLPGQVIVGMDANSPKLDHPEHCENVWWWTDEPKLLGHEPKHHLRDALRTYLAQHPQEREMIRRERPAGPLAVSHRRGMGPKRTDCRYDFILCTPGVQVHQVQYLYDQSRTAGSDHALVVAEVEL